MNIVIGFIAGFISYYIARCIKLKSDSRKLESRQMEVKLESKIGVGAIIGSVLSVEIRNDEVVLHFIDGDSKTIKLEKIKSLIVNASGIY